MLRTIFQTIINVTRLDFLKFSSLNVSGIINAPSKCTSILIHLSVSRTKKSLRTTGLEIMAGASIMVSSGFNFKGNYPFKHSWTPSTNICVLLCVDVRREREDGC